ncbi:MAG TPA: four helix bundle protein [Candidatus Kryptobacter bacterium]|nr:four helix bundle protein [Candidatus Kryptobacter bacterium]
MGRFSFEDLDVWQRSVDFSNLVINLVDSLDSDRKHFRLIGQLEAAVTSIPMNIAEGKGRFSKKEFVQFLYIARGSLFETITLLEIFRRQRWISDTMCEKVLADGEQIGKMLSGLINSIKKS